ncbi:alpha/beta hydrolase [Kitasatospora sp. NPDC004669]|uniref:alpha/beta hydrolase n=1 Tax=Kitasatospora sp. NPDC004669 TaxID=3154555 RepID=UPI0033B35C86
MSTSHDAPHRSTGRPAGEDGWLETVETIAGAPAAGPDELQHVKVLKVGPAEATRVLVLLGGREGAAGGFRVLARELARTVPGLQVWAVDRREQNLADLRDYQADLNTAIGYYLGGKYTNVEGSGAPFAGSWGLDVLLRDVRQVVKAAADDGRRDVVLGGHSVGGAAVAHYAAWDFDGTPGYIGLSGLVQIDGGVRDAFKGAGMEFSLTAQDAVGWRNVIADGSVFENATSLAVRAGDRPEDAAILYHLAARCALTDPHGPALLTGGLPAAYATDGPLTNAGLFGKLVDAAVGHPGYAVHSGRLGQDGDWIDDGPTPLARIAEAHAEGPSGAFIWYTLNRVMLDYVAGNAFADNDVTRELGLRLHHVEAIDIPLYAFGSSLTNGTVAAAAEQLAASTAIPAVTTYTDLELTHQDLLYAVPEQNLFLRTLAEFLRTLPRR